MLAGDWLEIAPGSYAGHPPRRTVPVQTAWSKTLIRWHGFGFVRRWRVVGNARLGG